MNANDTQPVLTNLAASMTPREIVHELDKHIIGQDDAKRAVAIALRNRWRRMQLDEQLRVEVHAQKYFNDRSHRRRQDRNCPTSGKTLWRTLHQDRGDQIH